MTAEKCFNSSGAEYQITRSHFSRLRGSDEILQQQQQQQQWRLILRQRI